MTSTIQFLIHCCKSHLTESEIKRLRSQIKQLNEHQLSSIMFYAHFHGVFPLFYDAIKNHATDLVSNEVFAELKQQNMSIAVINLRMTGELIKLSKTLREHGIEILAFKGPALTQIAYGDITKRQFSDLDIFIKRNDFRKAASVLQSSNYQPHYPIEQFIHDKVLFDMNNDCPFYHLQKQINIELHWDFFRKLAIPSTTFQAWQSTEAVSVNKHQITTLSNENHLLYHSLHGSKHIWHRLMWIVDIDRFVRAIPNLNWEEILVKSHKQGTKKMFLLGIHLAIKYFQTPVPEKIKKMCLGTNFDSISQFIDTELSNTKVSDDESLSKLLKVVKLRDTPKYKIKMLIEFIFKPGINERRALILPDSLFWLYWLIRPVAMLMRFVKRKEPHAT